MKRFDKNGDGVITPDEMLPWGEDECVLYEVVVIPGKEGTFTPGTYTNGYANDYWNPGPRSMAVDFAGNLWAGCWGTMKFYYVEGPTGRILSTNDVSSVDHHPYGALVDSYGILWSSGYHETVTRAWVAVETAWRRGATYAGCSAGAMILGAYVPDVRSPDLRVYPAFNWVANAFILPHFDRLESFRPGATAVIRSRLAEGEFILGIDENTALVGRPDTEWEVLGASRVSLFTRQAKRMYSTEQRLILRGTP